MIRHDLKGLEEITPLERKSYLKEREFVALLYLTLCFDRGVLRGLRYCGIGCHFCAVLRY